MTTDNAVLSDAEVDAFHRDGVLVPKFRLSVDEVGRLRALADDLITQNEHLGDEPMASPHVPGSGVQGLKSDPAWLQFPMHDKALDMVGQLIGRDIILWGSTLIYKPAGRGRIVPWHRDGRYWPIKPLATTSVWIAVDDATVQNGCLRVIPGSHKARETGRHFTSARDDVAIPETLHEDEYDEAQAIDVELEAGQMAIFDIYTAHGSNANTSDRRRVGYAMRYMPSASYYDRTDIPVPESRGAAHHTRPLILARGVDRSGRNDFLTGHPA